MGHLAASERKWHCKEDYLTLKFLAWGRVAAAQLLLPANELQFFRSPLKAEGVVKHSLLLGHPTVFANSLVRACFSI